MELFCLSAIFGCLQAGAQITYVDAVDGSGGNTYETGGALGGTASSWTERTAVGNGGILYQGGYNNDSAELTVPAIAERIHWILIRMTTAYRWRMIQAREAPRFIPIPCATRLRLIPASASKF